MFKFFPDKDDTSSSSAQNIQHTLPEVATSKQVLISEPHYTLTNKLKQTPNSVTELKNLKGLKLKCVNIVELPEIGDLDQDVVEILGSTSDLKSGVYEGEQCNLMSLNLVPFNFHLIFKIYKLLYIQVALKHGNVRTTLYLASKITWTPFYLLAALVQNLSGSWISDVEQVFWDYRYWNWQNLGM